MATKAKITPEILRWARKSARISLDKAAKTISKTCTPDRVREWESDDCKNFPSVAQVKKLARLYRRPFDVFFLKYIPKDFTPLKDFRKDKEESTGTGLVFMMREIQEKHEWLSEMLAKNGQKKLDFVGRYNVKSDPLKVAHDIRQTLGINSLASDIKPIRQWIEKAEKKRIFISLTSNYHTRLKLDSDVFKGFAIADKRAPFIFINSEDWEHGQLMTLVHELAHIWIGVSGISNDTELKEHRNYTPHLVERFCNLVMENALLPEAEIAGLIPENQEINYKQVARHSKKFGVNPETFLLRAHRAGLLSDNNYTSLKREAENAWKEFLLKESQKPKSSGGPNYYVMQLRRSSKSFANIVMDFYKGGKLSGSDASRLLNVKEANFQKFEKYIYK